MARLPILLRVTRATFDGLTANNYPDGQQFVITDEGNALYEAAGADGARTFVQLVQADETVDLAGFGSGAATDGQVATADGAGGVAWEDATGGGGTYEVLVDYAGEAVVTGDAEGSFDWLYAEVSY